MFKLLGFLLGSAASIIAIVLLLGMPEFHLSKMAGDTDRFDAAVEKLKEKRPAAEITPEHDAEQAVGSNSVADTLPEAASDSVADTLLAAGTGDEPLTTADAVDDFIDELPLADDPPLQDDDASLPFAPVPDAEALAYRAAEPLPDIVGEASWYAFWNPFRSEIAARGFVSQLEKVTGLDYRIVKIKAGVYQVAFAYADDQERQARLSQIQAATGLDLSGT